MSMLQARRVGFKGSCDTPYCGAIEGYFCVKCRHFVVDCRCQPGWCACKTRKFWASVGERKQARVALMSNMQFDAD